MKITKGRANLMLLAVAILWGSSYVFAKEVVNSGMHSGLINGMRGLLGASAAAIVFNHSIRKMTKNDLKIGVTLGLINFCGYYLQTMALQYTTPAKNAFLTTMYVVISPVIMWLVWHERLQRKDGVAIVCAVVGMAILSGISPSHLTLQYGDFLTLISAVFWALQIIFFARLGYKASSPWVVIFTISCTQGTCGWITALISERSTFAHVDWFAALPPLFAIAIVVTFMAQGLQLTAQHYTSPTAAGLILMLESFFGSVLSVILGFDPLTHRLIIGGAIMILANVIMQVDLRHIHFLQKHD
ncbi:DMT family transporter [Limosilactobacillus secaliphilus]|uniref:Transport protein n=1 Tax=Limosilactobacillus secaliphilus TaxID=396268 RepID=A0A0R2I0X0_9LACO|nr:DMT family transporter [Limosilactobacillus secaliphilus]KRN58382.1 transport protein [Limosilactobacillus secaliphilus]